MGPAFILWYISGILLILAFMVWFADSNWKTWRVHPAGFQMTWIVSLAAFFHFREVLKRLRMHKSTTEIPLSEYDENQSQNPYAPPMQPRPLLDNPMDRREESAVS